MSKHYHLAWYGWDICDIEDCPRPKVNPEDEPVCTDRYCEGGCEAARKAAELRRGLEP